MIYGLLNFLIGFLFYLPGMLWAMTIHEFSHGYVAYKLGDPTAARMGRLTLDPMKHIDPLGFIALIFAHIGWAKPVPVSPHYFRNPKRDMMLVAIAGPASNFLSAIAGFIIWKLLHVTGIYIRGIDTFLYAFTYINVAFGTFNLLPIPPLDGWRIVEFFWKDSPRLEQVLPFTIVFLVVIFWVYPKVITGPIGAIYSLFFKIFF